MTEAELRAIVVGMAHDAGWRVFSMPMAKGRRPVKDAVGFPDLTLAKDRRVVFLELKQEDGILSPAQLQWMRDLPAVLVVRPSNVSDVLKLLA
jgi:hypothetical protein